MSLLDVSAGGAALRELRAARRRRRLSDIDVFEGIYRVYLTAIVGTVAVLLLAGVTGDRRIGGAGLRSVHEHGAAVVGLLIAGAVAVGLRSGGRGGPLVVEAPDVAHVLLAPVDRASALRGPGIRQLRFLLLVSAATGGVAGLLAARRLPGGAVPWVASGAATATAAIGLAFGAAMVVSGLRLNRWIAGALALVVVAWSVADLAAGSTTSPGTLLGLLALWPLALRPLAVAGLAPALAAPAAGMLLVGGTSLEAMQRRAGLAGQLRFAVTLQDLRTVIVLRRQLAQEAPRSRPWIGLPAAVPRAWLEAASGAVAGGGVAGGGVAGGGVAAGGAPRPRRLPVWRRGWHGALRWPALRWARLSVMGAAAGAALVGVWKGTTPLVVVAGVALFVAGLDAVEPLAQEIDHPDRAAAFPAVPGRLHLRHLAAGAGVMLAVAGIAMATIAAMAGGDSGVFAAASVSAVTGALAALGGAAVSVIKGPPPPAVTQSLVPPEMAGARAMLRLIWPPVIAVIGVLPVLAARAAHRHGSALAPALAGAVQPEILLLAMVLAWVRFQADAHRWWDGVMAEARRGGSAGPGAAGATGSEA